MDGKFYIANTNNHSVRIYGPESRIISTLEITSPPRISAARKENLLYQRWISRDSNGIHFRLDLPEGYHWNRKAEQVLEVSSDDSKVVRAGTAVPGGEGFGYFLPLMIKGDGKADLRIEVMAYFCEEEGLCCFHSREFKLPIVVGEDALREDISVAYLIQPGEGPE
jgi:hypothetical protein